MKQTFHEAIESARNIKAQHTTDPIYQTKSLSAYICDSVSLNSQTLDNITNIQIIREKTSICLETYLDLQIEKMIHIKSILQGQREASIYILYIVVGIVVCGIIYSGYQLFFDSYFTMKNNAELKEKNNTIEINPSKIKVTSSTIGIIILTISIAFFYLYIQEVYTIKYIE